MSIALLEPPSIERESDSLYEVIDGVEVEKPPMSMESSIINSRLASEVYMYTKPRGMGETYVETLIRLNDNRNRRSDFIYVTYENWPKVEPLIADSAWVITPELCVEVVSPSNTAFEVEEKLEEYFAAGVQQVWVVHPHIPLVKVYLSLSRSPSRPRRRYYGARNPARFPPADEGTVPGIGGEAQAD